MSKTPEELAKEYCASPYEKHAFLAGYQAAKQHAHAALEEAESRIDELQSKLSDAGILTTEHLIDASKTVSSSETLNNWISVKDRLPKGGEWVLVDSYYVVQRIERPLIRLKKATNGRITGTYKWKTTFGLYVEDVSFWMPLPEPPEE